MTTTEEAYLSSEAETVSVHIELSVGIDDREALANVAAFARRFGPLNYSDSLSDVEVVVKTIIEHSFVQDGMIAGLDISLRTPR